MADFLTRLHLAWLILRGRAVMYRVKTQGTVTLAEDYEIVVVGCEFGPQILELDGG